MTTITFARISSLRTAAWLRLFQTTTGWPNLPREHYTTIVEYVNVWERWLDGSLPREVLERLNHSEENLKPFYDHVLTTHDMLRAKLKAGEAA